MKVMTIVGTRPEIIKLSRVIDRLDQHTQHVLVHTGQNFDYELNEIFFEQLAIRKPDYFLHAAGETAAETIGNVIRKADEVLKCEEPDALLLYGDTNSCLAVIPAKRRKIPIFHMEAGNRCFDQRVPEEINRKIVDHLSDINMTLTEHARRYLIAEGLKPETIFKIGSSMKEVYSHYRAGIDSSRMLEELMLEPRSYFVVSLHREENIDSDVHFAALLDALQAMACKYGMEIIVSTHPRMRMKLEQAGAELAIQRIRFLKPMGLFDYVHLQMNAICVVSDSGTITEEASLLHFPAVTVRQAHERPEGMDEGVLMMAEPNAASIVACLDIVMARCGDTLAARRTVPDYDVDNVSDKVLNIIMSYTGYVNRTVWFK